MRSFQRRVLTTVTAALLCAGCHGATTTADAGGTDSTGAGDPIVYSGSVHERGTGNLAGVTVTAVDFVSGAVLETTTTDDQGQFSMTADHPMYLRVAAPGYLDTAYYFEVPDNDRASIEMFTQDDYNALFTTAGVTQDPGAGVVVVQALNIEQAPTAGVVVFLEPAAGTVMYDGPDGALDPSAPSTANDGIAYILGARDGMVEAAFPMGTAYDNVVPVPPRAVTQVAIRSPYGAD